MTVCYSRPKNLRDILTCTVLEQPPDEKMSKIIENMKNTNTREKHESLVPRTLERPTLTCNKNNNEKPRDIQVWTQYKCTTKKLVAHHELYEPWQTENKIWILIRFASAAQSIIPLITQQNNDADEKRKTRSELTPEISTNQLRKQLVTCQYTKQTLRYISISKMYI
jgi:hypothetical protein